MASTTESQLLFFGSFPKHFLGPYAAPWSIIKLQFECCPQTMPSCHDDNRVPDLHDLCDFQSPNWAQTSCLAHVLRQACVCLELPDTSQQFIGQALKPNITVCV